MISFLGFIIKISLSLIILVVFTYNSKEKKNSLSIISIGIIASTLISVASSYSNMNLIGPCFLFIAFVIWFLFHDVDSVIEKYYIIASSIIGILFGLGNFFSGLFISFVFYGIINYFDNIISFLTPENNTIDDKFENNTKDLNN